MTNKRWHLKSGSISEVVHAPDQWAAYDTLRDRPAEDFGCIVVAEPDEGPDYAYPIRTSILMFQWFRDDDARRFIERMMELEDMPDTTDEDLAAAGRASAH